MNTLKDILYRCSIKRVSGNTGMPISGIIFDSRKAASGIVFVAVRGTQADGHDFIPEVASKGVAAIVCEKLPDALHRSEEHTSELQSPNTI